ncbi:uncharacterized protein LOC133782584 isoform X1 [Humulus lupulus]|uniref:uncharacterized protein LOC133782584 isoform X1 n=1 Tax=Humulus lupulus TaxID=3486 RepID=UPI002B40C040|nr:uncharacterized protein LOC133782584 isoform X1 [Humulus lupulus]
MNYFDRYISRTDPLWAVMITSQRNLELLSLCCLTLAWKMRDPNFILSEYLEEKPEINVITSDEILAMEHHILMGINWHLRPVTALCFVPYFEQKLHSTYGFRRRTINQIIIQSHRSITVTHFRPSVIAASALLAASSFLYPLRFSGFVNQIISEIFFRVEDIEECTTAMIDLCNELKLMIESAVPEGQFLPKKKVRAGITSQKFIEIGEKNASEKLKQVAAEPSQEAGSGKSTLTCELSEQVAAEPSQEAGVETSKGTSELSERGAAEPSQEDGAGKSKGTSELSEQGAAEPSQEAGARKYKEVSCELPEQVAAGSSQEDVAGKSKEVTSELPEQVAAEPSLEAGAGKSKKVTFKLPEQVAAEPSEDADARNCTEVTCELPEQVAAEPSQEDGAGKSEEVTCELPEQVAAEPSQEAGAGNSKKVTFKLPQQVAAEPSQEAGTGKSTDVTFELPEQVTAEPSQEAVVGKSKDVTFELPKEVAAETSDMPELEVAQTSEKSKLEASETSEKFKLEAAESSQTTPGKSKQEATEAAETSEQTGAEIPEQVASKMSEQAGGETVAKGKRDVVGSSNERVVKISERVAIETSHKWSAEKSIGVASNYGETSSQRPGKEKVKEVEMTIFPNMKTENYEMQFNFQLRWGTEESIAGMDDDFVIFSSLFDMLPPAPVVEEPEMEGEEVQPNGPLQQFCDFCCKCSCDCCKLL